MKHRELGIALTAVLVALAYLYGDSSRRMQLVRTLAETDGAAQLRGDANSITGYANEQHRLILPSGGADGYHWILQTERMLAGDGIRIREVAYDNAPTGREVHWSGSVRWLVAAAAALRQRIDTELTLPLAVERVAPYTITFVFALFLLILTPVLATRMGGVPAALCALGFVLVQPIYQYSIVGFLDHHALAAMCCFAALILLVAGGGGWLSADRTYASARRWFIAAAIAGAAGLWISAATIVPVLIGAGVAVIVATLAASRGQSDRYAPQLWRVWGIAAALASLFFYLLEYFPADLGFRLEVNHPLYAIAWLGAGDFLCRLGMWRMAAPAARRSGTNGAPMLTRAQWQWLLLDGAAVCLLPATILVTRQHTFHVTDPFLWALHSDYIVEFSNLGRQLAMLRPAQMLQICLPIVLLPAAALLWATPLTGMARGAWRVFVATIAIVGIGFVHGMLFYALQPLLRSLGWLQGGQAQLVVTVTAIFCDAAVAALFFVLPARGARGLKAPAQTALLLTAVPTATVLLLAFQQVRWLGIASTLALSTLVTIAAITSERAQDFEWTRIRRATAVLLLCIVLLPFPVEAVRGPLQHGYPVRVAVSQIVARDVAHSLRAIAGPRELIVLSSPTVTSWLVYFGGVRGVGTLYWENRAGLETAARIYGARTDDEARALIDLHGITHIVIDFAEPFVREYARLSRGERLDMRDIFGGPQDAFALRILDDKTMPAWLKPIPYTPPDVRGVQTLPVLILEVVRN